MERGGKTKIRRISETRRKKMEDREKEEDWSKEEEEKQKGKERGRTFYSNPKSRVSEVTYHVSL